MGIDVTLVESGIPIASNASHFQGTILEDCLVYHPVAADLAVSIPKGFDGDSR